MNPYLIFILTVLILKYLLNLTVSVLELRSLEPKLPQEFKDIYSQEKYQKSQEYTHVRDIFSRVYSTFWVILTLIFILVGGFNLADLMARNFNLTPILTGLIFIGSLSFLSSLISLPFSIYSTFVIEERFGFNKTTIKTFILDMIKGTLLSIIIGAPLLSAVLWFFQTTGNLAWLYVWIAVTLFTFIIQF
ncbi:MAG: M48 family peptidase, partial [Anaerolineae bacterium]|nr:M48 family peptidase [Anaerolineae bacterium]